MQEEIPRDNDVLTITENADMGLLVDYSHDDVDLVDAVQDRCFVRFMDLNLRRVITGSESEDTFRVWMPDAGQGVRSGLEEVL